MALSVSVSVSKTTSQTRSVWVVNSGTANFSEGSPRSEKFLLKGPLRLLFFVSLKISPKSLVSPLSFSNTSSTKAVLRAKLTLLKTGLPVVSRPIAPFFSAKRNSSAPDRMKGLSCRPNSQVAVTINGSNGFSGQSYISETVNTLSAVRVVSLPWPRR